MNETDKETLDKAMRKTYMELMERAKECAMVDQIVIKQMEQYNTIEDLEGYFDADIKQLKQLALIEHLTAEYFKGRICNE